MLTHVLLLHLLVLLKLLKLLKLQKLLILIRRYKWILLPIGHIDIRTLILHIRLLLQLSLCLRKLLRLCILMLLHHHCQLHSLVLLVQVLELLLADVAQVHHNGKGRRLGVLL